VAATKLQEDQLSACHS